MDKIKNIFAKHSTKFYLFAVIAIILIGFLLRIMGLDKPDGFWYDEALSFSVAKESFPLGILHKLYTQDFHAPLYYFFMHFYSSVIHNNELLIRLSSVVFGVISLPIFYLVGKELDSRKAGLYTVALASINSCLIYYSQEVRFYSLLMLLSTLAFLFMIRIKRTKSKIDIIGFALTNLLILYTYSMGNLYVFFEVVIFAIYLFFINKKTLKSLIISQAIVALLYLPYFQAILHFTKMMSGSIAGSFWWVKFGIASPVLVLQDWFTPVLVNLRSHPTNYYDPLFSGGFSLLFTLFIFLPIIIYLTGIIKAVFQKNFSGIIFLVGFAYLFTEIILASQGKLGLMTRYTLIALPSAIITAGYGLSKIKNKSLSVALISTITGLSLFWLVFSPMSAPKMTRDGYHKYIVEVEKFHPTADDIIIIPYGGRFFKGYYLNDKAFILPFDIELSYLANQNLNFLFDKQTINSITNNMDKNKALLRSYISSNAPAPMFEKYIQQNVLNRLKKNGRVFIIISGGINAYKPEELSKITMNDSMYIDVPIFLLLSSKTTNDILTLAHKNLQFAYAKDYLSWQMYIFKK